MREKNFELKTGLPTVPSKVTKTVALKGTKRIGKFASAERGTNVTINAFGGFTALFFLFPRKNMRADYLDHASPGAVGFANGSGWMTKDDFRVFMNHFIKEIGANKNRPTLLLLDNHTSHLSIEVTD